MVAFGSILKKLRIQFGYTQQQLAEKLCVTKSVISYYELQERYPSPEILVKLASIFHVSTDYLLGLNGEETISLAGLEQDDIVLVRKLINSLSQKTKWYIL